MIPALFRLSTPFTSCLGGHIDSTQANCFFQANVIDVFEIPGSTSGIHSPQVGSRPFSVEGDVSAKLLLNFRLQRVP